MKPVDQYIFNQKEPHQSIMLYLRSVILKTLPEVDEKLSYKIPFYYYDKKPMCYLNILKKTNYVDVAFIQGIFLEDKFSELKDYNNRKQVRSLQVKDLEDFDELMFTELLKEAASLLSKSKKAWNL